MNLPPGANEKITTGIEITYQVLRSSIKAKGQALVKYEALYMILVILETNESGPAAKEITLAERECIPYHLQDFIPCYLQHSKSSMYSVSKSANFSPYAKLSTFMLDGWPLHLFYRSYPGVLLYLTTRRGLSCSKIHVRVQHVN